jgi:hypothetical protein
MRRIGFAAALTLGSAILGAWLLFFGAFLARAGYNVPVGVPSPPSAVPSPTGSATYYYATQAFDEQMRPTPPSSATAVANSASIPSTVINSSAQNAAKSAVWFGVLRMSGADGSTPLADRLIGLCGMRDMVTTGLDTYFQCPVVDDGQNFITALSEATNTVTVTTEAALPHAGGCTALSTPWSCCVSAGTDLGAGLPGACPYDVGDSITVSGAATAGYNVTAAIASISGTAITFTDPTGSLASCSTQSTCSVAANQPAVIDLTMPIPAVDYTGACKTKVTLSGGSATWTDPCITTGCVQSCTDQTNADGVKCVPSAGSMAITGNASDTIAASCQ